MPHTPGEMRWHDATGTERHTDLVLQHLPAGREFAEALLAEDKATLLAALDTLQAALGELEFTHNNLKETNLRWHRGRFVPIRYYDARIGMAEPGTGDREAFAALRHRIAEAPAPRQTANDVTAPLQPAAQSDRTPVDEPTYSKGWCAWRTTTGSGSWIRTTTR